MAQRRQSPSGSVRPGVAAAAIGVPVLAFVVFMVALMSGGVINCRDGSGGRATTTTGQYVGGDPDANRRALFARDITESLAAQGFGGVASAQDWTLHLEVEVCSSTWLSKFSDVEAESIAEHGFHLVTCHRPGALRTLGVKFVGGRPMPVDNDITDVVPDRGEH